MEHSQSGVHDPFEHSSRSFHMISIPTTSGCHAGEAPLQDLQEHEIDTWVSILYGSYTYKLHDLIS